MRVHRCISEKQSISSFTNETICLDCLCLIPDNKMASTDFNVSQFSSLHWNTSALTSNVTGANFNVPLHPITKLIELYMIPVLCFLGFVANTASSVVFLQKSLRSSSSSVFLAARGLTDNGFLSTLFVIWLSRTFNLELGAISGTCCLIIFLSYFCGCMSVWLVVFVTVENYIRICKPFIASRFCKPSTATVAVVLLVVLSSCIYSFPFWAMNPDRCIPYDEFYFTVQALVSLDSILTLVIPFLFISVLMAAIVCHMIKFCNRRERRTSSTSRNVPNTMAKVTKMLFAVSVSFIVLSVPSHVFRLNIMLSNLVHKEAQFSLQDEAIQQVTLLLYYMSMSLNIMVYFMFGSKFRKCFCDTFCFCGMFIKKLYVTCTCKPDFECGSLRKRYVSIPNRERKNGLANMQNGARFQCA